ncbi:MAG: VTT domain-containing protein [Pseudonocardiales bacterium]
MPRRLDRLAVIRFGVLLALIAAGTVTVVLVGVPDARVLRERFAATGLIGALGFGVLYAALTLTPVPAAALTIAAGATFGLVRGVAVVVVAATVGAVAAFYLGRRLGREAVQGLASGRLDALDALLARRGVLSVILVRLVPLFPYAAVNYIGGLTGVRTRDYLVGTAFGIVPATVAYVAVGAYGSQPGSPPFVAAIGALVAATGVGVIAARRRRRGDAAGNGSVSQPG